MGGHYYYTFLKVTEKYDGRKMATHLFWIGREEFSNVFCCVLTNMRMGHDRRNHTPQDRDPPVHSLKIVVHFNVLIT